MKTIYPLLWLAFLTLSAIPQRAIAHPLKLSISEIEYSSAQKRLSVSLRLFLMDVNEALLFDPNNNSLAFCQPNESAQAEPMLLEYLNQFFYLKANGRALVLDIKDKQLHGEGINEALGVEFEFTLGATLTSLEVKNAVFTDLFFDQNNIVYLHIDEDSTSFMLNQQTPVNRLTF